VTVRKLVGQGLALSGGGYRASLFHLGVLRRLHELGVLQKTTQVSSVSGGSILAGFLAHRMLDLGLERPDFADWERDVSAPFRNIVRSDIRTRLLVGHIGWNWLTPGPRASGLERAFRKRLGDRRLVELPKASPSSTEFIFLATDIEHGVLWRFTPERIGNYIRGMIDTPESMTISLAVAASACFPPVFGPIKVRHEGRVIAHLTDGGVYDNTGMEPIWLSNKVVLVSDAGTPFDRKVPRWFGSRIMRYVDIGRNQVGALRRRAIIRRLHDDYQTVREFEPGTAGEDGSPCPLSSADDCFMRNRRVTDKPIGAFWRLGSQRKSFIEGADETFRSELLLLQDDWYGYPDDGKDNILRDFISEIRTDMDAFTRAEAKILENHGYVMGDLAIRRHARELGRLEAPFVVPHRDIIDPAKVREALRLSHSRLYFWRRWFD
jgi:NTE family protein